MNSEDTTIGNPLTCATCNHWHAQPRNALNLTAPLIGECRVFPPQLVPVPQPGGRMGATAIYPQLVDQTLACGQHAARLSLQLSEAAS